MGLRTPSLTHVKLAAFTPFSNSGSFDKCRYDYLLDPCSKLCRSNHSDAGAANLTKIHTTTFSRRGSRTSSKRTSSIDVSRAWCSAADVFCLGQVGTKWK